MSLDEEMSIQSDQRLEYLYKEYVRLSDNAEAFIKSTLDDFKLFGVVGAIIVIWKPISELILSANSKLDPALVLFLGFLSLLTILGVIALFNIYKQSYAWYLIYNLQLYEVEIRKEIGEAEDSKVFNFNISKQRSKFSKAYRLTFRAFVFLFALAIVAIPFLVLCYSNILYAGSYLLISLLGSLLIYTQVYRKMIRLYFGDDFF